MHHLFLHTNFPSTPPVTLWGMLAEWVQSIKLRNDWKRSKQLVSNSAGKVRVCFSLNYSLRGGKVVTNTSKVLCGLLLIAKYLLSFLLQCRRSILDDYTVDSSLRHIINYLSLFMSKADFKCFSVFSSC